jgi:hypothetical protein
MKARRNTAAGLWLCSAAALALSGAIASRGLASGQNSQSVTPGAVGTVAGHVPEQAEQADQSPVDTSASASPATSQWWSPGSGKPLAAASDYADPYGRIGIVNTGGPVVTKGHPFFEPLGANGRACVTCHQPADAMSVSVQSIRDRWAATGGKDPIFAAVDGMNCPNLPPADPKSHSLLLDRGTFRIFLPWPPKAADGTPIDPEFSIEVVRDPTGCNTSAKYGLHSRNPMVSIFRRPRVLANMKYILSGGGLFNIKDGSLMAKDPETGKPVSMQLMADGREPTVKTQAVEAGLTHLQTMRRLSPVQLERIGAFERQIYIAQSFSRGAGDLNHGGPTALGPVNVSQGEFGLGDNFTTPSFGTYEAWKNAPKGETAAQHAFRASVMRGWDVFFRRPFYIRDVTHLNTVGLGNPIKRTCGTCHNARFMGNDIAPGWMDLGTTNLPWARVANDAGQPHNPYALAYDQTTAAATPQLPGRVDDLPLFKLTCKPGAAPHPFLGRVIYTTDPGRALISGRCSDIGAITMQQMRGLAARAPYFANGSARTLRELVDYYNLRFDIRYSDQEKQDLINFLSVL